MSKQKGAFLDYEADQWFKRNQNKMQNYDFDSDPIIELISKYNISFNSVVEVGSSFGYRLAGIKRKFNTETLIGVEPSKDAIRYGKQQFPEVYFINTTMDDLSEIKDKSIDLLIVGFVFYIVDRELLYKCLDEINRVISENGKLIILDFYSFKPVKKRYNHISDFEAFTFKCNYFELFTISGVFELLDFSTLDHLTMVHNTEIESDDLVSLSLLRKVSK
jgi:ubiquinone/menaquinone biosynthesis C-methylase UbiE